MPISSMFGPCASSAIVSDWQTRQAEKDLEHMIKLERRSRTKDKQLYKRMLRSGKIAKGFREKKIREAMAKIKAEEDVWAEEMWQAHKKTLYGWPTKVTASLGDKNAA